MGFIYEAADLLEAGKPRKVTSASVKTENKAARTLVLFELLRRCELVAFEVEGLPGPTYQLVKGEEAARFATVVNTPSEARQFYFAALSIKLMRADPARVADALRSKLTAGVGQVEVFENTHTLVVCDFSDRLEAAFETAQAADVPAAREDDLVLADFVPVSCTAKKMGSALERLRARDETWQLTVNENSNLLLVSGRRDQVDRVQGRFSKLDGKPLDPAFSEEVQTFKVLFGSADDAAKTLRQMFAVEIETGTVQVGAYERAQKIVFRGSRFDATRAAEALKAVDVDPGNAPKDKK